MFDYALPLPLLSVLVLALIVLNAVWVYELYTIKRVILQAATVIANDYKEDEDDYSGPDT